MNRFWKWVMDQAPDPESAETRTLFLNGTIAEESWFDDDVTPALFKSDLEAGEGDITVWINSPGGDCFAAAQIYNMLRDYKGKVTVKIDGLAASAASVIAMAGDTVLMSPVAMMMIHNPATIAMGDHNDMQKAIDMLSGVKDSIINAYAEKTGMSRNKLSRLMEDETWMDATKAIELGFADNVIQRAGTTEEQKDPEMTAMLFCRRAYAAAVTNKLTTYVKANEPAHKEGVNADDLMNRLRDIKKSF